MTAHFTAENTEGFTDDELNLMNQAHDRIMGAQDTTGMDDVWLSNMEKNVGDAINNAFVEGVSLDELVAKAML